MGVPYKLLTKFWGRCNFGGLIYRSHAIKTPLKARWVTSVLCKIFDKLLKKALLLFLTETRFFSPSQHGFPSRRSCLSNLEEERVTRLLDEGHTVNLVYLDFAKAFDSVNHWFLLAKVKSSGIDRAVLNLIESCLSTRSYQVQIDGILSEEAPCHSGAPQGSVIGPFLFLLYLNDLLAALSDSAFLFADDVKMVFPRSQSNRLLSSLSSAWAWAGEWDLPINPKKCSCPTVGNLTPLSPSFSAADTDHRIPQVTDDTTFTTSAHCREAANTARRLLFMVRRSFCELSKTAFIPLYCAIVWHT